MSRLICFTIILISLLCLSCNSFNKKQILQDASSLYNQIITFPTNMICFNGTIKDTLPTTTEIARIIVWCDSTECSLCTFKGMYHYDNFYNYCIDSINIDIRIEYIFSPSQKDLDLIIQNMKAIRPTYTVYIDSESDMYNKNSFIPIDRRFHVFLLDKNNVVKAVGSPLINNAMRDLYINQLKLLDTSAQYQ